MEDLGTETLTVSAGFRPTAKYEGALQSVGETPKELGAAHIDFVPRGRNRFAEPLQHYCNTDMKDLLREREGLETACPNCAKKKKRRGKRIGWTRYWSGTPFERNSTKKPPVRIFKRYQTHKRSTFARFYWRPGDLLHVTHEANGRTEQWIVARSWSTRKALSVVSSGAINELITQHPGMLD